MFQPQLLLGRHYESRKGGEGRLISSQYASHSRHFQFVEKSEQPKWDNPTPRWWDPEGDIGRGAYEHVPKDAHGSTHKDGQPSDPPPTHVGEKTTISGPEHAAETDAIPPIAAARVRPEAGESTTDHSTARLQESGGTPPRLPMMYSRTPPTNPVLRPEYRYCQRDGFVKPLRAHHCRACGTVSTLVMVLRRNLHGKRNSH